MDKPLVICTTLLIERSPQALPLGAACVASALKHDPLTAGSCDVRLIPFCAEDADYSAHSATTEEAGAFIANSLLKADTADKADAASKAPRAPDQTAARAGPPS